jgi:hypothetical protein
MVQEARSGQELDRIISSACTGLLGDFRRLRGLFVEPHSEMEPETIARNLMEFGRGQISGIEQTSAEDAELIDQHVSSITVGSEVGRQFCAYVSGCVLGWVQAEQLSRADLGPALDIVQSRAAELFPQREDAES